MNFSSVKKLFLFFSTAAFLMSFSGMEKQKTVIITTNFGTIKIRLYNETPQHRDNFIKLVDQHFFDSTLFHRVIKEFMIQGGDPDSKHAKAGAMLGNGDVGYRIPAEFNQNLYHKKGVLAAARDDNPEKASSGCQFYIVVGKVFTDEQLNAIEKSSGRKIPVDQRAVYKTIGGTPHLDQGYTVFGEVIDGQDVVDKIVAVKTDANNRPLDDVRMFVKRGKDWKVKK